MFYRLASDRPLELGKHAHHLKHRLAGTLLLPEMVRPAPGADGRDLASANSSNMLSFFLWRMSAKVGLCRRTVRDWKEHRPDWIDGGTGRCSGYCFALLWKLVHRHAGVPIARGTHC